MNHKIINTKNAPEAIGPYSQAVIYNGTVYCSGQIALNADTMTLAEGGITNPQSDEEFEGSVERSGK